MRSTYWGTLWRFCCSAASPTRLAAAIRPCRDRLRFAAAAGTAWLFAARALSGFSTGLAAGAATAWIAETNVDGGTGGAARIAAAANFFGSAAGPLIGGTLAQLATAPLRLPFFVYLALLCTVAVPTFFVPETVAKRKRLSEVSLKLRLGVPRQILLQFVSPAVTGFATFAGFHSALIPSLLRDSLHQAAPGGTCCRGRHCL